MMILVMMMMMIVVMMMMICDKSQNLLNTFASPVNEVIHFGNDILCRWIVVVVVVVVVVVEVVVVEVVVIVVEVIVVVVEEVVVVEIGIWDVYSSYQHYYEPFLADHQHDPF